MNVGSTYKAKSPHQKRSAADAPPHPSNPTQSSSSPYAASSFPSLPSPAQISANNPLSVRTALLTILRQSPRLITQQILDPPQLLRQCAGPDDRTGDFVVRLDLPRVDCLAHVEIDSQTRRPNTPNQYACEISTWEVVVLT